MENVSVVFVVGNDIVGKLNNISRDERMTFILGGIDKDYFGKHFISIEEIGEYWKYLFDYLCEEEVLSMNYKDELLFEDKDDFVLLRNSEQTMRMLESFEKSSKEKINHFLRKHDQKGYLEDMDFHDCIHLMKGVCQQAASKQASLLFCIDKH